MIYFFKVKQNHGLKRYKANQLSLFRIIKNNFGKLRI